MLNQLVARPSSVWIRQQREADLPLIDELLLDNGGGYSYGHPTQLSLVNALRNQGAINPNLSIVADYNGLIIGYLLLIPVELLYGSQVSKGLSMTVACVDAVFRNRGIGTAIILDGHRRALEFGFDVITVVSKLENYMRFGYLCGQDKDVFFPLNVPPEYCLIKELTPGILEDADQSTLKFPDEFPV